nr:MAG TPA: hypothetical protein [Bacteriophage sp.]
MRFFCLSESSFRIKKVMISFTTFFNFLRIDK